MDKPEVSIIISNYNGLKFGVLQSCLSSVSKVSYIDREIMLVDNGSTDGSAEYAERTYSSEGVIVIRNGQNNYTQGLNLGYRAAKGKYIIFLNNDITVDVDFVQPLVDLFEQDARIGVVQCKLIDARTGKIDSMGEIIDELGYFRSFFNGKEDASTPTQPFEVPCTNGSAFAIRRAVLTAIDAFDPMYYSCYEDVDMSLKVRSLSYAIVTQPRSVVHHSRGSTLLSESMKVFSSYNFEKNKLATLLKFHSRRRLAYIFPTLLVLYLSEFFYLCLHRKTRLGITRLRAIFWVYSNIGHVISEREKIHGVPNYSDPMKFISKRILLPF